jgi:ADP-ribosyl-[dinitrogen reductase] hydrolase
MYSKQERIQNSLWGIFVADALAMPAHWYYNRGNIKKDFEGGVKDYNSPPHPHPESFMVGMRYHPNVQNATNLKRPYNITGKHTRFYDTNFSELMITQDQRDSEHGNAIPNLENRFHYHHGLKKGENTLGANLVRVLMRSVINQNKYNPEHFLESMIAYVTTQNSDPYIEVYLREWFVSYSEGADIDKCAASQRDIWSIGSHGGLIRPLVLSLLSPNAIQGVGTAISHQNLTHSSEILSSNLSLLTPLLHDFISGSTPHESLDFLSKHVYAPKINGEALFKLYKEHQGPGNIDKTRMWHLHMDLEQNPLNFHTLIQKAEDDIVLKKFATACYPEHGVPLLLYTMYKHHFHVEHTLLSNVNMGGDNVHRGMVLGLLVGAVNAIPTHLQKGLLNYKSLQEEIEAFTQIACQA